jgi:hypothetical protein
MKRIILQFSILFLFVYVLNAQIVADEKPFGLMLVQSSISHSANILHSDNMQILSVPNRITINMEDSVMDSKQGPLRFAYPVQVNYTLYNSGTWQVLTNGDKLWKLKVKLPSALSTNALYDKFWLPEGAKFFVYSEETGQYIGAVLSEYIGGSYEEPIPFATALIYGESVVFEYYQPASVTDSALISISRIDYGYRYIKNPYGMQTQSFGEANNCNININCPEGNDWQIEKHAIVRISIPLPIGTTWCSGSLINNTTNDKTPYVLTADHSIYFHDAINGYDATQWIFYWDYEHSGCSNNSIEPAHKTTTGAIVVANNNASDFALLKLSQDPRELSNFIPYYLGWDRSGNDETGGVGIHHPKGDVKKISPANQVQNHYSRINWSLDEHSDPNTHWNITFYKGLIEKGSSGSPFLNNNHHIIGQYHGGVNAVCNTNYGMYYGKFNVSWTGNEATDNRRKLQPWLDPINSGVTVLDGIGTCDIIGTDFMIRDKKEDTGYPGNYAFGWDFDESPDIWVRNQKDGFTNPIHESPKYYTSSPQPVYVYVRVWNRSCNVSTGSGDLALYWSLAAGNSHWPKNWDGTEPDSGNIVGKQPIPNIAPGGNQILEFEWNITSNILQKKGMTACLLARIEGIPDDPITGYSGHLENDVYHNNNIGMHNVTIVPTKSLPININGKVFPHGGYMLIGNASNVATPFDIFFGIPEDGNTPSIIDEAEVRIITDDVGWAILHPALEQHPDIHIVEENEFIITKGNIALENIYFEPEQRIMIYVGFSFLTQEIAENEDKTYKFFVGQKYSSSFENSITGSEHFVILRSAESLFSADAGEDVFVDNGESVVLSAEQIGEDALYNWYDKDGILVHEGQEFTTVVTADQKYKLEVIALSNGFKDYDEVEVKLNPSRIETVFPNPTDGQLTVMYTINNASNAQILITNFNYFTYTNVIELDVNENSITFNLQEYPSGMYVISLICNGQNVGSQTFIKE